MKKTLWTLFLLWASSAVKRLQMNPGDHIELTRLKMSLMYVRCIKTFRLLFMSLLGMGICLVFLLVGLIVFHITLFLYAPWSAETKLIVGLLSSAIYLLATIALFSKVFAADKWLEIFHAEDIMARLKQEDPYLHKESKEPTE
jgi:type VI protein secretion system component VasK